MTRRTRCLVTLMCGLAAISAAPRAGAQAKPPLPSTESIAASGRRATVTILTFDAAGDTVGQGSGVIVRADGVIATNWHVMVGASAARIRFADGEVIDRVLFLDGDSLADIALLRVPGLDLPAARLTSEVPAVGTRVLAIGAPLGLSQTVSDGLLSAIRLVGGKTIIQTTAAISPGSSGGPVFDTQGRVFAIAMSTLEEGQALNFATPIRYGLALLPLATTTKPLAAVFAAAAPERSPRPSTKTSAERSAESLTRLTLPEVAKEPDTSLAGTYVVRHQRVSSTRPLSAMREGLFVLDPYGNGLFLTDRDAGTGIAVWDVVTTRTGRVGFSMMGEGTVGYQTDEGFAAIWVNPKTPSDTLRFVAQKYDLGLQRPDGLYDVSGRLSYWTPKQERVGTPDRWFGTVSVVAGTDSAWVLLELKNAEGGGAFVYAETPLRADKSFIYEDKKYGKLITGRFTPGALEFDWVDRRKDGSSFRGLLSGRRR